MAEVNRRDFLAAAAAMAATCALCGSVSVALADEGKYTNAKTLPPEKFDAGKIKDYPKDTGSDKYYLDKQVLLSNTDGKIIALTAVCPHKKALVKLAGNNQFVCPRHGSRFTLDGVPAPKPNGRMGPAHAPLVHYAISINSDNHIIVDTGTSYKKDQWNAAGASIAVPEK